MRRWLLIAVVLLVPLNALAQQQGDTGKKKLSREELAQLVAPIALYPDDLVAQILMASTYPLEVVQADRWAQQNKGLKGDALASALEKQTWDPSVKSLVNFPSVLSAMSQKLDLTTSLGDAYLEQPKDVMDAVQELRRKAQAEGNLKSGKEQKVVVEKETIVIQQANPQVVYVPSYSPTVVYGAWPYPAYPPAYYYPPPPAYSPAFTFATGVAVGMAWGYAWGHCDWHGGDVDVDVNRNINVNQKIDRSKYQQNKGTWKHDPAHRKNVAYRDNATARKYGQSPSRSAQARREARGYSGRPAGGASARPAAATRDRAAGAADRGAPGRNAADRGAADRGAGSVDRRSGMGRESAFSAAAGSGRDARLASSRGEASRQGSFGGSGYRGSSGGFRSGAGGGGFRSGGGFGGGRRR